ncbi:MAG: hypothetical protein ACLSVD_01480 [Eggerthellaceae bacterium]
MLVGGKVVERGVHEELLAADGHYAALWRSQQVDALERRYLWKGRDGGAAAGRKKRMAKRSRTVPIRAKARNDDNDPNRRSVGRPTGVKTQAFLYVLCGLAEAAVYVALLPLLRC